MSTADVLLKIQAQKAVRTVPEELNELTRLFELRPRDHRAFRRQAFRLLRRVYLPRPELNEGDPGRSAPFSWVRAICELCMPNAVLDCTLLALCTALAYAEAPGNISHERAIDCYTDALGVLSNSLADNASNSAEYTLASMVNISTCEIWVCSTDDGWRAHVQGIYEVLQLRYAQAAPKIPLDIWNSLCSRLRLVSVLSTLTRYQKGILTRSQWSSLMPDSDLSDVCDALMDITCELPFMLEDLENRLSDPGQDCRAVIKQIVDVLLDTYRLQSRVRQTSAEPIYSTAPAQLINPADDAYNSKLFPFAIIFRSLTHAVHCILTWSVQLQIYASLMPPSEWRTRSVREQVLWAMDRDITDMASLDGDYWMLPSGSMKEAADQIGRMLCQSVEYCHRPEKGLFGPQTMLYAQFIMRSYYRQANCERELSWCLNVQNMHGIPTRCSVKTMTFQGDSSYRFSRPP